MKRQVVDLGEKGVSDGMAEDIAGRIYPTNHELNAMLRRLPSGDFETVVRDPRLIWSDTLAIQGGYPYIPVDQRVKFYVLMLLKIDAKPVVFQ